MRGVKMTLGYVATYDNQDLIVSTCHKGMIDAFIDAGIFEHSDTVRLLKQGLKATCEEADFEFRTVNLEKGLSYFSGELYSFQEVSSGSFQADSTVKNYGMLGAGVIAILALLSQIKR